MKEGYMRVKLKVELRGEIILETENNKHIETDLLKWIDIITKPKNNNKISIVSDRFHKAIVYSIKRIE